MDLTLAILRDPYMQVTYLLVTGVTALYCLIGLWAATSSRHWFLRALVPVLALAALIPIRAHEPLIFYAMIMAEIVVAVSLWRWWRGNVRQVSNLSDTNVDSGQVENLSYAGRFRFGLRDIFLSMVVVGVIAWTITGFAGVRLVIDWPGAAVASLLLAALTLAAWNVVTSARRRVAIAFLLATLTMVVAIDILLLDDWLQLGVLLHLQKSPPYWTRRALILSLLYLEFTAWLHLGMVLAHAAFPLTQRSRWRRAAQLASAAAILAFAVPLGMIYWQMTGVPDMPPILRLAENVYPQILVLGSPMESASPARAEAIYQELVPLLDRTGYVPLDLTSVRYPPGQDPIVRAQQLRSIGRAIDARRQALDGKGEHDQAVECSLFILKICQMQARGGLAVDTLVSHAVEGVGTYTLIANRKRISAATMRKAVRFLIEMDSQREPTSAVFKRDFAYFSRTMRWRGALERQVACHIFGPSPHPDDLASQQHLDSMQFSRQAACRLLYTDLAIRLFQKKNGRLPQSLEELVPEYLDVVPLDPYTDNPLIYRVTGDDYALYSVGTDRTDNGGAGKVAGQSINSPGIDWDLDSLVGP